jgi:hypothetical protein
LFFLFWQQLILVAEQDGFDMFKPVKLVRVGDGTGVI